MRLSKTLLFTAISIVAFSQQEIYPKILVFESDTVLAFTLKQARQLSVFNEERKECFDIKKDLESQIKEYKNIFQEQDKQINNLEAVKQNQDAILQATNDNKLLCEQEKGIIKTQRNDQIKYKWFSIGTGTLTTLFMTYLYITK